MRESIYESEELYTYQPEDVTEWQHHYQRYLSVIKPV